MQVLIRHYRYKRSSRQKTVAGESLSARSDVPGLWACRLFLLWAYALSSSFNHIILSRDLSCSKAYDVKFAFENVCLYAR